MVFQKESGRALFWWLLKCETESEKSLVLLVDEPVNNILVNAEVEGGK